MPQPTDSAPMKGDEPEVRLDLDRSTRIGMPEAIFCSGKTVDQCVAIVTDLLDRQPGSDGPAPDAIVATRVTDEQRDALDVLAPTEVAGSTMIWRSRPATGSTIAVVAAGTSDLTVAAESRLTLEAMGHTVTSITDVGVAGLHRLTAALPRLDDADVVVAIAGMEGALPTVLAGLIPHPIVAVPTSVGYGASFDGATALLGMMASCAPGIAVVGIDNGYGAACAAHRIVSR